MPKIPQPPATVVASSKSSQQFNMGLMLRCLLGLAAAYVAADAVTVDLAADGVATKDALADDKECVRFDFTNCEFPPGIDVAPIEIDDTVRPGFLPLSCASAATITQCESDISKWNEFQQDSTRYFGKTCREQIDAAMKNERKQQVKIFHTLNAIQKKYVLMDKQKRAFNRVASQLIKYSSALHHIMEAKKSGFIDRTTQVFYDLFYLLATNDKGFINSGLEVVEILTAEKNAQGGFIPGYQFVHVRPKSKPIPLREVVTGGESFLMELDGHIWDTSNNELKMTAAEARKFNPKLYTTDYSNGVRKNLWSIAETDLLSLPKPMQTTLKGIMTQLTELIRAEVCKDSKEGDVVKSKGQASGGGARFFDGRSATADGPLEPGAAYITFLGPRSDQASQFKPRR